MAPNRRLFFLLLCLPYIASGQLQDTLKNQSTNKKRLTTLSISAGLGYSGALIGLSELWYKGSNQQSFHFFNDNTEWKQVDKIGHFYAAFYSSYAANNALRYCSVNEKKSAVIGSLTGFLAMLPIEILDGFSSTYGASSGDLIANAAGSTFFLTQSLYWKEIRIHPKFSFHTTAYASMRPNVLGDNLPAQILKDYNGQTYWLSIDIDKFIRFPKWLNLAVGYGAHDMVFAHDYENISNQLSPYRQYYLSLDLDLTSIKTKSRIVKSLIFIANMIKIPGPAIEFSRKGIQLKGFYF